MDDDELTPEQQFAAEDPESMVPRELMRGRTRPEMVRELRRLGWTEENARAFVERVAADLYHFHQSPQGRASLRSEARREIVGGAILTLLGLLNIAWCLLAMTLNMGFILFVFAFPMGLMLLNRGVIRWRLYRGDKLPFDPTA